jgi:pilus assembly protein CpaC
MFGISILCNNSIHANKKKPKEKAVSESSDASTKRQESEVKVIEVNSVNFIQLKEKATEIFIPNPKVADIEMLSDSSLYLTGLAPGITFLVVQGENGKIIVNYQIKVTYPLTEIKKTIFEMYPDADVEIVSLDDSVILKGKVASPEMAKEIQDLIGRFVDGTKIVNKLSIETATQVMLKVKIAEVSRTLTKSLGINWKAISRGQDVTGMHYGFISGDTSSFPAFTTDVSAMKTDFSDTSMNGTVNGARWLAHTGGQNGLSALIEALANESFASILAEPTLIALSGKTATFKAGGEESYVVKQSGSDSNTTEFKSWGTAIEFTPVVMSEDRINITVKPTVSSLGPKNPAGVPSLTTKEAATTVELGSGQSLVIAGLLQIMKNSDAVEAPFLADLPLIGALFRKSSVSVSEKELVIIVTPYIVKPSSKNLRTPVDMIPRMYSPLESILSRKFHQKIKKFHSPGFSIV